MKRYLIKIGFNSVVELEKSKMILLNNGVGKADFDYALNSKQLNHSFKESSSSKGIGSIILYYLFGTLFGAFVYFFSLFRTKDSYSFNDLSARNFETLGLTMFSSGVLLLVVGLLVGKKYKLKAISFKTKNKYKTNFWLSINVDKNFMDRSMNKISDLHTTDLEIVDTIGES